MSVGIRAGLTFGALRDIVDGRRTNYNTNQEAVIQGHNASVCNAGNVNDDDEHASVAPQGQQDLPDIEIEELRRQIETLTTCLAMVKR